MSFNLVYQAYGREDVIEQTFFSIASLYRQIDANSKIKVWIYTDKKSIVENFTSKDDRIHIIEISDQDLKNWRGEINFVHRVKIEVLKNASTKFKGPICYCDGDTVFLKDPTSMLEQVNDQTSIMHLAEADLGHPKDPLTKKIAKFIRTHNFFIPMNEKTIMWNAGVIAVSEKNKIFWDSILKLTDEMHKIYPKHVTEQLAVSAVLQNSTQIMPAHDYILHYWDMKPQFQDYIHNYLSKFNTIKMAIDAFSLSGLPKKKIKEKSFLKKLLNF